MTIAEIVVMICAAINIGLLIILFRQIAYGKRLNDMLFQICLGTWRMRDYPQVAAIMAAGRPRPEVNVSLPRRRRWLAWLPGSRAG